MGVVEGRLSHCLGNEPALLPEKSLLEEEQRPDSRERQQLIKPRHGVAGGWWGVIEGYRLGYNSNQSDVLGIPAPHNFSWDGEIKPKKRAENKSRNEVSLNSECEPQAGVGVMER